MVSRPRNFERTRGMFTALRNDSYGQNSMAKGCAFLNGEHAPWSEISEYPD